MSRADRFARSAAVGLEFTPEGKTALVTSGGMGTGKGRVSTIDVKSRTSHITNISVGAFPFGLAITPNGKTLIVANNDSGTVSTIDLKTKAKHRTDIPVGRAPGGVAITLDGKTAFVSNNGLPPLHWRR